MKEAVMCASIIAAIVLAFVGIIKLPFKSFKEKHPNWYKAVFCILSLGLAIGLPFIAELYILNGQLYSVEFLVLILTTVAGVFGLYTSYEGLGLKALVKVVVKKLALLFDKYSDSKLAKIVGTVGIEKLNEINEKLKAEAEASNQVKVEDVKVEQAQ